MHAHDRTYLASLGFADPDKKDRRHDLACQYLATPDIGWNLVEMFGGEGACTYSESHGYMEVPIFKGEGQYRTTIGFLDVLHPYGGTSADRGSRTRHVDCALAVEVKVAPAGIGDIIRQINFYRGHKIICHEMVNSTYDGSLEVIRWVVATPYRISAADRTSLKSAGIAHVRLSDAFDAWCAEQEAARDDPAADVTI